MLVLTAIGILLAFYVRRSVGVPMPLPCPSSTDCECRLTSGNEVVARCQRADTPNGFPVFTAIIAIDNDDHAVYSSMSLANAGLTSLPSSGFRVAPCRALDLTGNAFDRQQGVADDAFEGLETTLNTLVLTECNLVRVPPAIGRLVQLQTIHLDGNKIQTLKRGTFKKNARLVRVFLSRNGLMRIDADTFDGLGQLRELRLSHNQLTAMPPTAFSSLPRLTSLDLSNNFIHQIFPGTFNGLSRLIWLELDHNSMHVVDKTAFAGLGGLQSLDLTGNPLRSVENGSFSELKRLRYLSLNVADNVTVEPAVFRGLGALVELAFGEIGRNVLPTGLFGPLRNLRHLTVSARHLKAQDHINVDPSSPPTAVAATSTVVEGGLRPNHFRSDMNWSQLSVWVDAIFQCRCSAYWIRKLVEHGVTVQGSCGATRQLLQCVRLQNRDAEKERTPVAAMSSGRQNQQQEDFVQSFISDDDYLFY